MKNTFKKITDIIFLIIVSPILLFGVVLSLIYSMFDPNHT